MGDYSWTTTLATKIYDTWQRGAPLHVWEEELRLLDDLDDHAEGRAGTAYLRLRRSMTRPPSIAEFLEVYRAVEVVDKSTREECSQCDGCGWVAGNPFEKCGITYTTATSCAGCSTGRRMARAQRRINARNAGKVEE